MSTVFSSADGNKSVNLKSNIKNPVEREPVYNAIGGDKKTSPCNVELEHKKLPIMTHGKES